jgi:peptidoglycan/LPS O-acetylase OafA/YrhL
MRIKKLDGLRGVFSLMIVFYHYPDIYLPQSFYNNFFIRQSYIFVDFFFILSGFVISLNYVDGLSGSFTKLRDFFKKRLIRIYPLLIFTSTFYLLFEILSRLILPNNYFTSEPLFTDKLISYLDSVLFMNSTPILGTTDEINPPSWSISAEMLSYFLFGFIVYNFKKKANIIFSCLIACSLGILFYYGNFFEWNKLGFLRGFVGFFLGYFLFQTGSKSKEFKSYWEWIIMGFLIFLMFLLNFCGDKSSESLLIGMFFIPTFFFLAIYVLLHSSGYISKFLESKPLQFFGKISYSLYLNHLIIPRIFLKPIFYFFGVNNSGINQLFCFIFILFVDIFYSNLTYNLIEKGLGAWLRKRIHLNAENLTSSHI